MALELPDIWTLSGLVMALLAIALAMTSVPSPSHLEFRISRICFVAAAILFLIKLVLWGAEDLTRTRLIAVAIMGATIAVALAYALQWVSKKEERIAGDSSATAPRPVVLHAKCGQPDISPFARTETGRFIFPFSPLENGRITHGLLELDKDATLTPEPEKTPSVVMQCSITNYGAVSILNARLTLGIEFRKAVPQGDHGLIGGELVQHVDWPIDVAKIEVGENKPFIFYLWNISPHFAMVRIYDNVSFQRVDENEGRIAKLVQPQVNPNLPLLFPPTRDITNKPN